MVFGRSLNPDRLLRSANYVREELPVRLAHRIRDFQRLPFIVVTNPHIASLYALYWAAFEELRRVPEIRTLADNDAYCTRLSRLLQEHRIAIPQLALGVREASAHFNPDAFVNAALRGRISRRVLAEQHIALTHQYAESLTSPQPNVAHPSSSGSHRQERPRFIGLIDTACDIPSLVRQCAESAAEATEKEMSRPCPPVLIEGETTLTIPCHPEHLSYVLHELLRNACRHTLLAHPDSEAELPPIVVTLCASPGDVVIRVSDRGGGIKGDTSRCFAFGGAGVGQAWKVPGMEAKVGDKIPEGVHLGVGLPISRVYMEYWGGRLELRSLVGWGTDAYVRIGRLGNVAEQLSATPQGHDLIDTSILDM
jgi:pyruvate dehydrogenase kinase 2/3/4